MSAPEHDPTSDDSAAGRPRPPNTLWLVVLTCALVLSGGAVFVLASRHVMKSVSDPEAAVSASSDAPAPGTFPPSAAAEPALVTPEPERAVAGGLPEPSYTKEDARRSAEEAGRDFLAAVQQGDAKRLVKYALRAKRATYQSEDDALRDLRALSFDEARVVRSRTMDDKAVLIAAARVDQITDDKGQPSPIDVVLQLQREGGHWKLFRQQWLIATPLAESEQEALQWLESAPADEGGAGGPVRKIR